MKKVLSLLLVLIIAVSAFVACGNKTVEKDYTLSIGVAVTEDLAKNKITESVATIVTDADGKIVLCRIDCVDYQAKYDDEGALNTSAPASKVALGDNYVMPAGSWAKQVNALEAYVIGKTQAEVAEVAVNGYATDAELKASCSFNINDLVKAIDNAFKSEHKISFTTAAESFTAGLSVLSAVKDSSSDESKNAKLTVNFAASVLVDGKVVASIIDTAEAELKGITEEGAEAFSFAGTKREQGDAYDQYSPMAAGRWYQQADAFAKSAEGKTAADIATLATEGVAGCTMTYSPAEFKAAIEAAVNNAR